MTGASKKKAKNVTVDPSATESTTANGPSVGHLRSELRHRIRAQTDVGPEESMKPNRPRGWTQEVVTRIEGAADDVGQVFPFVPFMLVYGITALWLVVRLTLYSMLIAPAALVYVWHYFFDSRIIHRVRYGPRRRNYLDVYLPPQAVKAQQRGAEKLPVVIGVMGGAWVMGHRAWNTQFGIRLLDAGVILVAVDYRNYPIGQVPDMVEDVSCAIAWVRANISTFGGDVNNMVLHAQSAGAHLSALLMLEHGLLEAQGECGPHGRCSSFTGLKGCVLMSGPYDLEAMQPHMISRGLNAKMLTKLTVDGDLAACSPILLLDTDDWKQYGDKVAASLPPIHLFHGKSDQAVPSWSSVRFAKSLQKVGVKNVKLDIREGCTHTLPIVEGPMRGSNDMQVELVLPFLLGEEGAKQRLASLPTRRRLLPEFLVRIAEYVMPY